MNNLFLTNYTDQTFLDRIKDNLRRCTCFMFSVSFIKKAGLVLLIKDIDAALARGVSGKLITSTYQNFTDVESLKSFYILMEKYDNFECHLDFNSFHDDGYMTIGYHSKGYYFEFADRAELIVGSSNITRYALLKNIEWDLVVSDDKDADIFGQMLGEFRHKWDNTFTLDNDLITKYVNKLNFAIERWDMDYDRSSENVCIWRNLLHFFRPFKVCCKSFVGIVYLSGTISDHLYIGVFFIKSSYEKLTSFCQEHGIDGDGLLLYT